MEVTLAVLADAANVTPEGKLNILGIFDRINAPSIPWQHPLLHIVVRFRGDPADQGKTKALTIELHDADGRQMFGLESEIAVPPEAGLRPAVDSILGMAGLVFEATGRFEFRVTINGQTEAVIPLEVTQVIAQP